MVLPQVSRGQTIEIPDRFNAATYFVDRVAAGSSGRTVHPLRRPRDIVRRGAGTRSIGRATRCAGWGSRWRTALCSSCSMARNSSTLSSGRSRSAPCRCRSTLCCRPQDYRYLLEDSRAKVLIVSRELLPDGRAGPRGAALSQARDRGGRSGADTSRSTICCRVQRTELEAARYHKDDVAFWLYTSGTTGMSRAAVHLQHDMVFCSELYADGILGIVPQDRTFSIAKLFFAYGLGNALYCPFAVGATTVLFPGRPQPDAVFERGNRYRPTLFFGVPTAYAAMLHAVERRRQCGHVFRAPLCLRGRTAAGQHLSALAGALRCGDSGRHRLDGGPAHLPEQPFRRRSGPARAVRWCRGTS